MQQKKSAIVTGASSGIGFSIAKELCNLGYEVYGFGRNFSKAEVASYIETQPLFHAKVCDLLETQRMCDMAKGIAKSTQLHILVNAAGVGYYSFSINSCCSRMPWENRRVLDIMDCMKN